MKKITLDISHSITDEKILEEVRNNGIDLSTRGILKVTKEHYYIPYTKNEEELKELAVEWFEKYNLFHAYRDGTKLPIYNLVKIEIILDK